MRAEEEHVDMLTTSLGFTLMNGCFSLGLPVTIGHAGLVPFLVSFLIGFFVQVR